ncbi:hypothetical protein niasHT_005272 [Heterodera trifolii]|uniref:TACO1/YebC-like N-terminal domain-containing protein n=1 Tax=Heterodera trifolii TaxID=157864 RepID=A0ABD2LUS7_9BILA
MPFFPNFPLFRCSSQLHRFRPAPLSLSFRRAISLSVVHRKGHSHWQNTKDVKAKNDAIRATGLNEMMKQTRKAVKDGYDPKTNRKLQKIMEDMKKQSLPLDKFRTFLEKLKQNAPKEDENKE